jgi:hypothetical protein
VCAISIAQPDSTHCTESCRKCCSRWIFVVFDVLKHVSFTLVVTSYTEGLQWCWQRDFYRRWRSVTLLDRIHTAHSLVSIKFDILDFGRRAVWAQSGWRRKRPTLQSSFCLPSAQCDVGLFVYTMFRGSVVLSRFMTKISLSSLIYSLSSSYMLLILTVATFTHRFSTL